MRSPTFTAIDIGSHSIIGICAKKDKRTGKVDILAKSQSPCFGVRNGEVVKPLEVYDRNGKPFSTLFYHTDESMLWCANYLYLKKMLCCS